MNQAAVQVLNIVASHACTPVNVSAFELYKSYQQLLSMK